MIKLTKFLVSVLLVTLLSSLGPTLGFAAELTAQDKYVLSKNPIVFELHARPNGYTEPKEIVISRDPNFPGQNNPEIRFTMRMEGNQYGDYMPQDFLEIKTNYDSAWQSFNKHNTQIAVLGHRKESDEFLLRLTPNAWGPPGIYKTRLSSRGRHGSDLEVIVEIAEYAKITMIDPAEIHVLADNGPGTYRAKEKVTLAVDANHPNWAVTLSTTGLYYEDSSDIALEPSDLFLFVEGDNNSRRSLEHPYILHGAGNQGLTYELWLEAQIGWEHLAGLYQGTINVDLTSYE